MKKELIISLMAMIIFFVAGCTTFQALQQTDEKLISTGITPKNKIDIVKITIMNAGYNKASKDNMLHEGRLLTFFEKEVSASKGKNTVQISLGFKETDPPSDLYRNLTIGIYSKRKNGPATLDEINKMETLLYKLLIDLSGTENVIRGE